MKQIKFSEEYYKFGEQTPKTAILIEVFKTKKEDLHPRFIEYDTIYYDKQSKNNAYYKLPEGDILVLLFKSKDFIFTTIRRFTPQKYDYYLKSRWEEFEINIKND